MNPFRVLGDLSHFASKCILIHRLHAMRSGRGLSFKTQALYVLVFLSRYIDVFYRWVSLYNTFMKLFFVISSCYIIYLAFWRFRPMDEEESTDTIPLWPLIAPPFLLAFIFNYASTPTEILWSFSIILEAVAILPQLWMLRRTGQCEALTRYYVMTLGSYRAFYLLNWIWRYESERMYDPIAATCGLLQTIINFYFIYVYFQKYPNFEDIEREPGQRVPAIVVPLESEIPEIVVTEPVKGGAAAEAAEAREAVSAVGRGDVFVLEAAEEGRIVD